MALMKSYELMNSNKVTCIPFESSELTKIKDIEKLKLTQNQINKNTRFQYIYSPDAHTLIEQADGKTQTTKNFFVEITFNNEKLFTAVEHQEE